MSDLLAHLEDWQKLVGAAAATIFAIVVPYLNWKREGRVYETQRLTAAASVPDLMRQVPAGAAALYIDSRSVDQIESLGQRLITVMERQVDEIRRLQDELRDVREELRVARLGKSEQ